LLCVNYGHTRYSVRVSRRSWPSTDLSILLLVLMRKVERRRNGSSMPRNPYVAPRTRDRRFADDVALKYQGL